MWCHGSVSIFVVMDSFCPNPLMFWFAYVHIVYCTSIETPGNSGLKCISRSGFNDIIVDSFTNYNDPHAYLSSFKKAIECACGSLSTY